MKLFIKTSLIFFVIFFWSCNKQIDQKKISITGPELKTLIETSLQGDVKSSNRLDGLFNYISQNFKSYNKILIDSISVNNKNFYSILIENQNPVYNLFAIIDNKMNLFLKDESLNGFLNLNWQKVKNKIFAVVDESFRSKDIVRLKRTSFYSIDTIGCDLVFRQFTEFSSPTKILEQKITFISDTSINTEIASNDKSTKPLKDVFHFDVSRNKYLSNQNKFNNIVLDEINSLDVTPAGYQIADEESIKRLLGLNNGFTKSDSLYAISDSDFEIKLNSQWKKLGNYTIAFPLTKGTKGIKFINMKLGASLMLFKLTTSDSLENYFNIAKLNQVSGNKNLRVSEEFDQSKTRYQVFEFSCPYKKIILILEAPVSGYENYQDVYNNIVKNFKVNC